MRTLLTCVALCVAVLAAITGCTINTGTSGNDSRHMVPRKKSASPPAEANVGRNFSPPKFQKLAILLQTSPERMVRSAGGQRGTPEKSSRLVEDEFIAVLLRKGYTVASRRDVETALKELPNSERLGDTEANQVAKLLRVSGIIAVSAVGDCSLFSYKGKHYLRASMRLSARLISAETSEVVWLGTKSFTGDIEENEFTMDWLTGLFREMAETFPVNN